MNECWRRGQGINHVNLRSFPLQSPHPLRIPTRRNPPCSPTAPCAAACGSSPPSPPRGLRFDILDRAFLVAQRLPYVLKTRQSYRQFWEQQVAQEA